MDLSAKRNGCGTVTPAVPWTSDYSRAKARADGWEVLDCGRHDDGAPRMQIQRVDDPGDGGDPRFAEDRDAWQHVVDRARAGSALHRAALSLVDPVERMVIEATCGGWPGS